MRLLTWDYLSTPSPQFYFTGFTTVHPVPRLSFLKYYVHMHALMCICLYIIYLHTNGELTIHTSEHCWFFLFKNKYWSYVFISRNHCILLNDCIYAVIWIFHISFTQFLDGGYLGCFLFLLSFTMAVVVIFAFVFTTTNATRMFLTAYIFTYLGVSQ